jgi:hypothetical protein
VSYFHLRGRGSVAGLYVKEPYQVLGQGVQRKKRMGVFKMGAF